MGFGVFIHRFDSIYDDSPAERYQFPAQYLRRVQACINDWIVYYEPRKVAEARGYFAVAKVRQVIPDPGIKGMYLALIEPGSYLDFESSVPFSGPDGVIERGLLNDEGRISGRAQWAVRPISASDFNRILELGFGGEAAQPRTDMTSQFEIDEVAQAPFAFEQERERVAFLTSRIVRDRVFRHNVLRAYDQRCAVTGLRLINGGGRAEVAAAHIRPVEENGPDILSNGIALCGTAHWMFDRGLISLADDLTILISRQVNDPQSVQTLINRTGQALKPSRTFERPHPRFLDWHRVNRFKQ